MNKITLCFITAASLLILLIVILVPLSFSKIEYTQVGLYKVRSTGVVYKDRVYYTGLYNLGPDGTFIVYPSTIQTKFLSDQSVWSLVTDNNAGTSLIINVSFQYKLIPENIGNLYEKIGTNYEVLIENIAITSIKNTAITFSSDSYLTKRKHIEKIMEINLKDKLIHEADCNITNFQLRKIVFPPKFYKRRLETAIQLKNNEAEEYRQEVTVIRGNTNKEVAYIEHQITSIKEIATAESSNIIGVAKHTGDIMVQDAKINSFKNMVDNLGFKIKANILSLDYLLLLEQSKSNIAFLMNYDESPLIVG